MSAVDPEGAAACGYQLTPISALAKEFKGDPAAAAGGVPALRLCASGVTKLGRKVSKKQGYCFPPNWVQVSSNHCEIKSDEHNILVTDTSTNGTFINNHRIPKHTFHPIEVGDILRLSVPPANEPDKLLEYRLDRVKPNEKTPATPLDAQKSPAAKRKRCPSPTARDYENGDEDPLQAMASMQRRNQELMDKLEASRKLVDEERARHSKQEAKLRAAEAQAREAAEQCAHDERSKAEASMQNTIEALKESLEKANERASSSEVLRIEEAKCRLETDERLARLQMATDAKQQVFDRQEAELEAMKQEAQDLRASKEGLEEQLRAEQNGGRELAVCIAALQTSQAELHQQLELEKGSAGLLQEQLKAAKETIAQQQASLAEAKAGRAKAEAEQAELQRRLNEAEWQNERAEEGHQQALGTSALQRAYLRKVLGISRHLREARVAEEAARAAADRAKEEADAALRAMQMQVLSALRSDLDASELSLEEMEEEAGLTGPTPGAAGGCREEPMHEVASAGAVPPILATQVAMPAARTTAPVLEHDHTQPPQLEEDASRAAAFAGFGMDATQLLDDSAMMEEEPGAGEDKDGGILENVAPGGDESDGGCCPQRSGEGMERARGVSTSPGGLLDSPATAHEEQSRGGKRLPDAADCAVEAAEPHGAAHHQDDPADVIEIGDDEDARVDEEMEPEQENSCRKHQSPSSQEVQAEDGERELLSD